MISLDLTKLSEIRKAGDNVMGIMCWQSNIKKPGTFEILQFIYFYKTFIRHFYWLELIV